MDGIRQMSGNVAALFFDAAQRDPRAIAFVSADGASVPFGELRERVERFAGGLARAGFGSGDKAVFMLPMSTDLYVAVLGALSVGGVAVFVDPWLSLRRIATLAATARPKAFVGSPKAHLLRLLAPELREIPLTIVSGAVARPFARYRFAAMKGAATRATAAPDASALITYTTGSSGVAKGVNRTHAILAAQHDVIRREFPAIAGDVDLTTFPVFALSNLAAGITTVIPPVNLKRIASASGARVLQATRACGVTTMAASPPLFDVLADHIRRSGTQAPALRRIVTGGAPVRDDQLRQWRAVWPRAEIVVAYGSSEAEPVASIGADERIGLDGGQGYCVGRPIHAVKIKLIPITRGPITELRDLPGAGDVVGELLVSGPHVCRDYVDDPRAFAENKVRDADGIVWHRMGDTGYFDRDGRFWLAGRVHSTINRAGASVHPQIVEQAARGGDPSIRRVAAVGMPDPTLGERVIVVVESDSVDLAPTVRARLVDAGLAPVDALLVTRKPLPVDPRHNSKIDYQRLRDMLSRGELE
jgi:acyl-CoA synthetase (AMP-forming)/AMP-acid ligase II